MLRSEDGALYTGISTEVERRLEQHRSGSSPGARALRGKKSLQLVYRVEVGNRSEASKLEYWIKRLSKQEKESLVASQPGLDWLLGKLQEHEQ